MYYGVFAPPPVPVVSPNGDGVDETQRLVVQGRRALDRDRDADGARRHAAVRRGDRAAARHLRGALPADRDPPAEGRWRLDVTATDDQARASTARQTFTVNNTLGDVKLSRRGFVARERGGQFVQGGVTLTRPARLTVTVETRTGGVRVATIAVRRLDKGRFLVRWNGTTRGGRAFVYGGDYVLRFRAANELGATELVSKPVRVTVIRTAPKPKKPARPAAKLRRCRSPPSCRRSPTLLTTFIGDYGLYAVFVLMLIDAVFPAASELVMVYGGAVAAGAFAGQDVVLFGTRSRRASAPTSRSRSPGTIGYTIGSMLGWWIGLRGGRPFLERHGRWLHLNADKLDRAERWFERWEDWAVFLGRLTPVVRSFVSIPAGVFGAPLGRYTLLTLARLGDLVLRLRRRRLGARRQLGGVPPRVPLRRLRDRRAGRRQGSRYLGWKLVKRRRGRSGAGIDWRAADSAR